jgi:hypothetical protein
VDPMDPDSDPDPEHWFLRLKAERDEHYVTRSLKLTDRV